MNPKATLVHVTHEAVGKIGGIGAVLDGFFTSKAYLAAVERTILVSPLFSYDGPAHERLGQNGEVLYSSVDGLINSTYATQFRRIEKVYNVNIVYGRRRFIDSRCGVSSSPEVILVDITRMDKEPLNEFKRQLYEEFGIRSDHYENLWEFEQYIRLALPAIAAVKAIGACEQDNQAVIIAHEFMGMPAALAAMLDRSCQFKTVFYAHEVATMRRIVEKHPGHDTMFYNVIKRAYENNLCVADVFGDQSWYFKHVLVDAAKYCDAILAVGDFAVDELRFLAPEFESANIDLVYNGIPAYEINVTEKLRSKERLQRYCHNILGYRPDYVFTHVTRLVPSKGLWRDLRVLEHMEKEFRTLGKTAVLYILSTETWRRRIQDILAMEASYNWPVAHREGLPDLSGGEAAYYTAIQEFNARSRNIKVVFINQFGFCRDCCGLRMPDDMEFMDIRKGSDVEFGQSIYEPFGIAQIEPLSFGGICVVSNVCGCAGFVRDITAGKDVPNVIIADYTDLDRQDYSDIEDMLTIDRYARDRIEKYVSQKVAMEICDRLPKTDGETETMIRTGYDLAKHMSWDVVVENYLLKSLGNALHKQHYIEESYRGYSSVA
jgi:glycosyltransferase involved in cell wall biosynthesis